MAKNVLFIGGPWHKKQLVVNFNGPIYEPILEDQETLKYSSLNPEQMREFQQIEYREVPILNDGSAYSIYAPSDMPPAVLLPVLADATLSVFKDLEQVKSAASVAVEALDVALSGAEYYQERNSNYFVSETRDKLKRALALLN